jgi:hypothetical protein
MIGRCDFVVKYDPSTETSKELTEKILYSLFILRLKNRKPAKIFISGESGEGKSESAIKLMQILLDLQHVDIRQYFNDVNIYTPLEYPTKIDNILHNKALKKVNFICMHEAREIIKAADWQKFLAQAVADVNSMSRSIKRLGIIIVSQFIRDITLAMRYTLDFYITVTRPRGAHARIVIQRMYKDDTNLEKPVLKKRRIVGYVVFPDGTRRRFSPKYIELKRLDKDIIQIFEEQDYNAKAAIIKTKLSKLLQEMEKDVGKIVEKTKAIADWYFKHPDNIHLIGRQYRGKFKLFPEVTQMHNLTPQEARDLETMIHTKFKDKGVIAEIEGEIPEQQDLNKEVII